MAGRGPPEDDGNNGPNGGENRQDDGRSSFLPPFANDENKEIDGYNKQCETQLEVVEAALDENSDRVNIMEDHLKNVQQELVYTQSRVDSKNKEIEAEDHLKLIDERELGRLRSEVIKLEQEEFDLQDKLNSVQKMIYKGNEKMDQFKLLMNWNQEELEQWALASRQKEEDNLALEKYKRADEARVKELNLHIEKLTKKVNRKKNELEVEVTETQAAQIQLDKTAEDFRALHIERQNLVLQWEDAVEAMKRRDAAIQRASEAFAHKKMQIREKQSLLDERAKFLEQEKLNNKEAGGRIQIADRGLAQLRAAYAEETFGENELQDEVNVVRNTLQKGANELAAQNATNMAIRAEVAERKRKLEAARKRYTQVELQLREEFSNLDSMEKKTNELHNINNEEQERLKLGVKEVSELKELLFKHSQELFALRTSERDFIAEIAGGQSQNKNLTFKISQLDAQVIRQQELLYAAEFNIQQLERKVARAGGERSDEERRLLNAKIEQLTLQLEERTAEHTMLSQSVKTAEDHLADNRRQSATLNRDATQLRNQIGELTLECETTLRSVRARAKEKEDGMVAHDVLKLEVKKLKDLLNLRADEVHGLENRKFQMQMSLEERKHETEVHGEILKAQLKTVQEDMHRATMELRDRQLKVSRLENKFDVMVGKRQGGGVDKEEGEERSQAYFVIKAAQDREQLQREGDDLDAKIRQAEKEVRALEATLVKLNDKNVLFRANQKPIADQERLQVRAELRLQLDRAYDRMKFKRTEERQLQADLEQIHARMENLDRERNTLGSVVEGISKHHQGLETVLNEQLTKFNRAQSKEQRLLTEMRQQIGALDDEETLEELDFTLASVRDGNRTVLDELRKVSINEPSVAAALSAVGIKLPTDHSAPPSRGGSVSSRSGSERSSHGSDRGAPGGGRQPGGGARQVSFY